MILLTWQSAGSGAVCMPPACLRSVCIQAGSEQPAKAFFACNTGLQAGSLPRQSSLHDDDDDDDDDG